MRKLIYFNEVNKAKLAPNAAEYNAAEVKLKEAYDEQLLSGYRKMLAEEPAIGAPQGDPNFRWWIDLRATSRLLTDLSNINGEKSAAEKEASSQTMPHS